MSLNPLERLLLGFLPPDGLAPTFDSRFYRLLHADLSAFDPAAAEQHYRDHGQGEGRLASPAAHRTGFVAQLATVPSVLEIGPAVRPVLRGPHVAYFDIADRAGLVARAQAEGYPHDGAPEIGFISPTGDLSVVDRAFHAAFSSHCIEHQPDLVQHLQDVARLLRPGGRYFLAIPDKRYCFDALLPPSSLEEVLRAHAERRRVHTLRSVREHYADTTHNDPVRHWAGDHADPRASQRDQRLAIAEARFTDAAGGYVDVHAWQFTPGSFAAIIGGLPPGLCPLRLERLHHSTTRHATATSSSPC